MSVAAKYFYSKDHTWAAQAEDGAWLVGITDYAQDMLGDVVFIDPPAIGASVEQFAACGLIESVKTGSDIHSPLSGTVVAINEDALAAPEKVNDHPYKTWLFKLAAGAVGSEALLDQVAYEAQL